MVVWKIRLSTFWRSPGNHNPGVCTSYLVIQGDFKVENNFSVEYYEQHKKRFDLGSGYFLLIFLILINVFLFFHHFSVPTPVALNNYLLFKFSAKNLVPSQCPPYIPHRLYWIYFFYKLL